MADKRAPTDPGTPPLQSTGRRPRARRETSELTIVTERARTSQFWGNRPPRAMSESVTMIVPEPAAPIATGSGRVPVARGTTSPVAASDDFLDEVPTNVGS